MVGKKGVPDWLNSPLWSAGTLASGSSSVTDRHHSKTLSPDLPPPPPPPPPEPLPPKHSPPAPNVGSEGAAAAAVAEGEDGTSILSKEDDRKEAQLLADFKVLLSKRIVNDGELRRLVCQGIPDGAGIRPIAWKILLGYLPHDQAMWALELEKKRSEHISFKDELLLKPSEITRRMEESTGSKNKALNIEDSGLLPRSQITHGEHPLSLGKSSVWNQYFQESETVEQIDRDVQRTHPNMQFFSGNTSFAKSNQEALRRILLLFAKLNPGIRYVQGMNEVLAPLFYVFRSDTDDNNAENAEADTFYCFVELLSGFRDNFCKQLDNSVVGIRATISKLSHLLRKHDEELWRHLEVTTKVNPQFYAFRWITLLLTQEFSFKDCLHIWDALLSDPEGPPDTLLRVCCAMLILVRRRLLAGDFTANLKLLQNYPATNINHILHVANKLRGTVID